MTSPPPTAAPRRPGAATAATREAVGAGQAGGSGTGAARRARVAARADRRAGGRPGAAVRRPRGSAQGGLRRSGPTCAARVGGCAHRQPHQHRDRPDAARGHALVGAAGAAAGAAVARDPGLHALAVGPGPARRPRPAARRAAPPGPAPSFEALARSVTQDVHPRSLLDELCRLGLAAVEDDDGQAAARQRRRRRRQRARLRLSRRQRRRPPARRRRQRPRRYAAARRAGRVRRRALGRIDGRVRDIAKAQWQALLAATVPALQALVDADAAGARVRDRRVRIGLYTWNDVMTVAPAGAAARRAHRQRRRAPTPAPRKDR